MYNIYCLQGFNNYYNRVVKKFDIINDYITHQTEAKKQLRSFSGINFNPNDCVNTTQILNWSEKWLPDYFIVEDDENNEFSRWFVMEAARQRGQQYLFTLRRDLLADYYNTILDAPCFIEKAILNSTDPFIYNNENMTFNQIKTNEIPLKDKSNCPWIVGYYADLGAENDETIITPSNQQYDLEINGTYNGWSLKNYFEEGSLNVSTSHNFFSSFRNDTSQNTFGSFVLVSAVVCNDRSEEFYDAEFVASTNSLNFNDIRKQYSQIVFKQDSGCEISGVNYNFNTFEDDNFNPYIEFAAPYRAKGIDDINNVINNGNYFKNMTYYDFSNNLLEFNNKIVRFTTSEGAEEFYRFTITKKTTSDPDATLVVNNKNVKVISSGYPTQDALWQKLYGIQKETDGWVIPNIQTSYYFYTQIEYDQYTLTATKIQSSAYKTEMKAGKNKLLDAPYNMFAIPYIEEKTDGALNIDYNGTIYPVQKGVSMTVVNEIIKELEPAKNNSGFIYDVQLLPYCPVPELITDTGKITLPSDNNYYYEPIYKTNGGEVGTTPQSYIFFAKTSQFTVDIPLNISYNNKKIESQTDIYRLVSPNYNGQFEFNIAKNNGITKINVDCTYKPFNPYIHLNPDFNNLYGSDFNDARGLICNGDFSLTMISNAWEQYQIQNKNYQNIFDRDIQNMDISNSIARQRDIYRGITGTLTGGMAGAITGARGGTIGAIAGAIGGAATGAIGGALNYEWNETLRNEAIDYKKDQFGYSLGNIQALPQSISKTTAFTANNKIYPILEYYTCKDEEKVALANKIAYNSMTVMRIGKINEFINNSWSYNNITSKNYIKGQVIRIEDINCDDFHVANEIANEVFKGAFYETKI